jgi:hypothetical protein
MMYGVNYSRGLDWGPDLLTTHTLMTRDYILHITELTRNELQQSSTNSHSLTHQPTHCTPLTKYTAYTISARTGQKTAFLIFVD